MPQVLHRVVGTVELDHWHGEAESHKPDVWHRLNQRLRFLEGLPTSACPGRTRLSKYPAPRIFVADMERLKRDLVRELNRLKSNV